MTGVGGKRWTLGGGGWGRRALGLVVGVVALDLHVEVEEQEGEDAEGHGEQGERGAVGGGLGEREAEKDDGDDEGGVAEDHLVAAGDGEREDEDQDVGEDHDGEEVVVVGGHVLEGRALAGWR